MKQVQHLIANKEQLLIRFEILKLIREFFWGKNILEVETPNLVSVTGQEPYISPMKVLFHDEYGKGLTGYLHTSVEYAAKKYLSAGFPSMFTLGKCYRDYEEFGKTHNPEFTMLEWYHRDQDFFYMMQEIEELFTYIYHQLKQKGVHVKGYSPEKNSFVRVSMKELWESRLGLNLDQYLQKEAVITLCRQKGYEVNTHKEYESIFQIIFDKDIAPTLDPHHPTIIYSYPRAMASLSKVSPMHEGYAERFELFYRGLELANVFTELTNPDDLLRKLKEEQQQRNELHLEVYDIDMEFVDAARKGLPSSSGASLGVDRLVQAFLDTQDMNSILPIPAFHMFS